MHTIKKKSAGIVIVDCITSKPVLEMDISINKIQASKIYSFGELSIKGVLPSEIIADKISVLSNKLIFRRVKDLVDIYALAHCVDVKMAEIYESHKINRRTLGCFTEYLTRRTDLEHAYGKLRGIDNKPDFDVVYRYVSKFIEPFILDSERKADKIWCAKHTIWKDVPIIAATKADHIPQKMSVAELIAHYQNEAQNKANKQISPSKNHDELIP